MLIKYADLYTWDVDSQQAVDIQKMISHKVVVSDSFSEIRTVAGADVSFNRGDDIAYAGVIVMTYPDLKVIETKCTQTKITFPYIPGLLSFREAPPLLSTFESIEHEPDLIIFDGQGMAHQRRAGIASHLGMILNKPSIGCAKSRLVGEYVNPGPSKGDRSDLVHNGQLVGSVLRTKDRVNPLFISVGHLISLETSIEYVLSCSTRYRLPEPTRQAHLLVNDYRKKHETSSGKVGNLELF